MSKKNERGVVIKVAENLNKSSEKLFIYVADKAGNVIEKVPVASKEIQLKTDPDMFHGKAEIYISGELGGKKRGGKVTVKMLKKARAYQPVLKLNDKLILELEQLPEIHIPFFKRCHVQGNLMKHFTIDGEDQVLPVCNVRVHICEIDPLFIIFPRIPDIEIIDLREKLLDMILREKFPPIPIPDPDPWPFALPNQMIMMKRKMTMKKAEELDQLETMKFSLPIVSDEIVSGLSSPNIRIVRRTLKNHYKMLYPYLCWWRRWWWFYKCDPIATVYPDCNGHFEHNFYYLTDKPDIYIWIEANIEGSWETVYKPWKPCGTYWNYDCDTDIDITLTDPRLKPCVCDHIPGEVVWIKRVNSSGINIRNIQQDSAPRGHITNGIGLTSFGGYNTSPFANKFPLIVQFGSVYPGTTIKNFRWKYRRIKDANLNNVSESYVEYDSLINKTYTYEKVNSDGDTVFYTGQFKLGPEFTAHGPVYKIPHVDAAVDVPAEPTARWDQDTYSIHINTEVLEDGLYEFIFELLDANGNVKAVDPDVFVVSKKEGETSNPPDADTISADDVPENYLLKNLLGKATGFRFVMRIDNQVCYPEILDAEVDGSAANSECGFAQYANKSSSLVTLKFDAVHPNDFAYYSFRVVRGNGNDILDTTSGTTPVNVTNVADYVTQTNNGYSVSGDTYSKDVTALKMLCTCDQAAFAESLFMYATHTNGNRRIWEYDGFDSAGFAIEPDES